MNSEPSDHRSGVPPGALDPEVAEEIAEEVDLHEALRRNRRAAPDLDDATESVLRALLGARDVDRDE